jgi:cellobiose phosphorylase
MAFAAMGNREKTWELLQLINPINHAKDPALVAEYKVEPYVAAADVYGEALNKGVAAGPGTPVLQAGCTSSSPSRLSA